MEKRRTAWFRTLLAAGVALGLLLLSEALFNVVDRTASPWKEAMTAARKGGSGRKNVNSRCRPGQENGNRCRTSALASVLAAMVFVGMDQVAR